MAGMCWMAVVLAFFLSAGGSVAAVDQDWLTSVIEGIKNQYALGDAFSLAVNVPQDQDPNNLQQVFQDDPADRVKQTVSEGQVYQGTRVVAAAQSGALSHVLENIQPFIKSSQGKFLIIYSEESPCGPACTNEDDIAGKTNDVIQNWGGYAFVFSKVVDVPDADPSQLSESFKQLEISKLGLDNIFRCYKPGGDPFQCTSCSSGGDVTPSCVANTAPSNQEQGIGEEIGTAPDEGIFTGIGEGISTGIGEGISRGIGEGISRGIGEGISTGIGEGISRGIGEGISRGIGEGISTGIGEGGGKRGKGGKVRKQCKRRGGCKGGEDDKVRKQCMGRKGCKGGKDSKVRKQCKGRKGCKGGKDGKVRKQCKGRKGCKSRKGGKRGNSGKVRKRRKQKKGGKGRKRGKLRSGRKGKSKRRGKRRKEGKRRKGGKHRKWGKRRGRRRG